MYKKKSIKKCIIKTRVVGCQNLQTEEKIEKYQSINYWSAKRVNFISSHDLIFLIRNKKGYAIFCLRKAIWNK